jgi:hypothetical protein
VNGGGTVTHVTVRKVSHVLLEVCVPEATEGSVSALMPIVTRDLLHGGAQTYGIMRGSFGMGAVVGALNVSTIRGRLGDEQAVRICAIAMGIGVAIVAASRSPC